MLHLSDVYHQILNLSILKVYKMNLKRYILICLIVVSAKASSNTCSLPKSLDTTQNMKIIKISSTANSDLKRNIKDLRSLCMYQVIFIENKFTWKMMLVYNPKNQNGPFWFLPHDDENTAFNSAIYSAKKYGGGFLAVESHGDRYFMGQDPNRNFGETAQTAHTCNKQKYAAPKYSKNIFQIIDAFKKRGQPYLAMHNNKNGWYGNGGSGGISILHSSYSTKSYPSGKVKVGHSKGIKDEDSLVYIAGISTTPPNSKLSNLLKRGMHTKYEVVNKDNNDCSMSNYVVLKKGGHYYNIESEHGDIVAQKQMIDQLMKILKP